MGASVHDVLDRWCAARLGADPRDLGEAFGLFVGERRVAEAMSHDPPVPSMADEVAEEGIEVAAEHRRQGFGRALLSHWTWAMQQRGRVCVHTTSAGNEASLALARSVGYGLYAEQRGLTQRVEEG